MSFERLDTNEFIKTEPLVYEDVQGLHEIYDKVAFQSNVILSGPKGIGKSLSVAAFAKERGIPLVTFDCSEDVRRSNMLGTFIVRGDEMAFILGPVTTAFDIANTHGQCILLMEEINALSPQAQKLLNPVADFRKRLEVAEAQHVFRAKGDLWVVGTMNSSVYGGVYELNEDLKSRFNIFPLDYPPTAREKVIVRSVMGKKIGKRLPMALVDAVLRLAHETRQNAFQYALSTRDVVQVLENIYLLGLEKALWIVTGKFEDEDLDTIKQRIAATFDTEV